MLSTVFDAGAHRGGQVRTLRARDASQTAARARGRGWRAGAPGGDGASLPVPAVPSGDDGDDGGADAEKALRRRHDRPSVVAVVGYGMACREGTPRAESVDEARRRCRVGLGLGEALGKRSLLWRTVAGARHNAGSWPARADGASHAPAFVARSRRAGDLAAELRERAQQCFRPPGSDVTRTYSVPTLERWLYRLRIGGVKALRPQQRSDMGVARVLDEITKSLLLDIRREHPSMSASLIVRTLERKGRLAPGEISVNTARRLYREHGLERLSKKHQAPGQHRTARLTPR